MTLLPGLLLTISNALLLPDLVAAIVLLAVALFESGFLVAHLIGRYRARRAIAPLFKDMRDVDRSRRRDAVERYLTVDPMPAGISFALSRLGASAWLAAVRNGALDQTRLRVERRLSRLTICIRLGPMVGLIGTLIPLGPGLASLAEGDLGRMAAHMTVAFNVTVVGLTTGAIAFVVASVRRALDHHDVAELAFIAETMGELEASGKP